MPKSRQSADTFDSIRIRTFGVSFPGGSIIPPHSQNWDQLIYASRGAMSVHTATGFWVVPSHRAVWVPAKMEYRVEMAGPVSMRTLYFAAGLVRGLPAECSIVNVPPLLRELILHTTRLSTLDSRVPAEAHLIAVILDQLQTLPAVPLQLHMPADPRALQVARLLENNPGDNRPLPPIARQSGASPRTIERLFSAETKMTFGEWRQRLRLLHALRLLAKGEPVTAVALEAGYRSTSAFIAMFRSELGTTPARYYAASS
jgi:AraC-like DNA-binding protein